ncbi:MAG: YraN family protein [Saprospiraceae bacterium]|nr:YraN family protein [Saprospiraceae bacterium]
MDPAHIRTGKQGEAIACNYLEANGYIILEKNWRFRRSEIDLIVREGEVLVFVEVKSRTYSPFSDSENLMTSRKEWMLQDAASAYMLQNNHYWEIRFDLITILFLKDGTHRVEHYKDVFF